MLAKLLSSKFFHNFKKVLFFLFFLLIFIGALFYFDSYFKLKNIEIHDSPKQFAVNGLQDLRSKNLVFLNEVTTADFIKEQNPFVQEVVIIKKYPSTLILNLKLYGKTAQMETSNGSFILAKNGRILKKINNPEEGLTKINFYQKLNYYSYNSGDFIEYNDIKTGLFFIDYLKNLGFKVDSLDITNNDVLLCNVGDRKILFSTFKKRELQQYELEEILHQFKIEGTAYKEIDLRFEKPIIKY